MQLRIGTEMILALHILVRQDVFEKNYKKIQLVYSSDEIETLLCILLFE